MQTTTQIVISGNIEAFIKLYIPPSQDILDIDDDSVSIYLEETHYNEIDKIDQIFETIRNAGVDITQEYCTNAFDFQEEDIIDKDLIYLSFRTVESMMGLQQYPTISTPCEHHQGFVTSINNVEKIELILWDSITWAEQFKQFEPLPLFYNNGVFFHKNLIEELQKKGIDKGLKKIPTTLTIEDDQAFFENEYFWVYSNDNIGNLTGNIILGKTYKDCQHPEIIQNRNFLETYSKTNYNNQDFCMSNFSGVGTLYVSQQVYQFLKEKIKDGKIPENIIHFTPVDLI